MKRGDTMSVTQQQRQLIHYFDLPVGSGEEEKRLLSEPQQVGGGIEEGTNGRTRKRGWGASLPEDKKSCMTM